MTKITMFKAIMVSFMGFASVKFNDCFVVENLKIVQGSKGLFLGMPSQPDGKGGYRMAAEDGFCKTACFE